MTTSPVIGTIGQVEITVCPAEQQPRAVDAIVQEQDVALLLAQTPFITGSKETYGSLINRMKQQKPLTPGTVILKHSTPIMLTAIIYDIEKKPVCREEWIHDCLNNIFIECEKCRIKSLAMPCLGVAHGKISQETSLNILKDVLLNNKIRYPEKIVIATP